MIFITRAAFVASCFRGVLPPVDFRAVCFVRAIATRLTVCIALENRFKGKFYFSFCYRPNPVREGVPEGEYPVTAPKQMLYGFGFTVPKKSIVVILNSHFH